MIGVRTIRGRLTAWYVVSVSVLVTALGVASWFAMRATLHQTIDRTLTRNLKTVTDFIQGHTRMPSRGGGAQQILQGGAVFGLRDVMVRAYDDGGWLIYEADSLAGHRLATGAPILADETVKFRDDVGEGNWRARLAYRSLTFRNQRVTIEVAEPMTLADNSLQSYRDLLFLVIPLAVGLVSLGGFWVSGRALAPIEQLTEGARSISLQNLSDRLAVPKARDELRQLTETLNAMLDRIERAVAQIRQFTADASHELRAPLTLIQTAAEFSLRRDRPKEELADALQKILRESRRTGQLTNNLLLLARADADQQTLEPVVLDLSEVCRGAVEQALQLAADKRLEISADLSIGRVDVCGDEASLQRLLLILVDNAVKYTPEGGRITLGLSKNATHAIVTVSDTGVGIATADLPHVFDRFWRADKVRSRALGGTGLGLAIAKWIVGKHNGTLTADSELGRGSTFTATLPLSSSS